MFLIVLLIMDNEKKPDHSIKLWFYGICFLSALVNICGYLKFSYSLSHYTGNLIETALILFGKSTRESIWIIAFLAICFVIGGIIGGFINRQREFSFEPKYGIAQLLIGMVFIIIHFINPDQWISLFYCAVVLGVQNSLIRTYKGFGFRTTHVTGTLSDLGTYISYSLQGTKSSFWKFIFEICLLFSFFGGTAAGLILYPYLSETIFCIIGLLFILWGAFYFIICRLSGFPGASRLRSIVKSKSDR